MKREVGDRSTRQKTKRIVTECCRDARLVKILIPNIHTAFQFLVCAVTRMICSQKIDGTHEHHGYEYKYKYLRCKYKYIDYEYKYDCMYHKFVFEYEY